MRGGLGGRLRIGAIPTSLLVRVAAHDPALRAAPRRHGRRCTRSTRCRSSAGCTTSSSSSGSRTSTPSRSRACARCRSTEERYVLLDAGRRAVRRCATGCAGPTPRRRRCASSPRTCRTGASSTASSARRARPTPTHRDELDLDPVGARPGRAVVERDGARLAARLRRARRDLRAIPLVAPATTRSIGLVWLDRDPEPLLARALLDVAAGLDLQDALDPVARGQRRSIDGVPSAVAARRDDQALSLYLCQSVSMSPQAPLVTIGRRRRDTGSSASIGREHAVRDLRVRQPAAADRAEQHLPVGDVDGHRVERPDTGAEHLHDPAARCRRLAPPRPAPPARRCAPRARPARSARARQRPARDRARAHGVSR